MRLQEDELDHACKLALHFSQSLFAESRSTAQPSHSAKITHSTCHMKELLCPERSYDVHLFKSWVYVLAPVGLPFRNRFNFLQNSQTVTVPKVTAMT